MRLKIKHFFIGFVCLTISCFSADPGVVTLEVDQYQAYATALAAEDGCKELALVTQAFVDFIIEKGFLSKDDVRQELMKVAKAKEARDNSRPKTSKPTRFLLKKFEKFYMRDLDRFALKPSLMDQPFAKELLITTCTLLGLAVVLFATIGYYERKNPCPARLKKRAEPNISGRFMPGPRGFRIV